MRDAAELVEEALGHPDAAARERARARLQQAADPEAARALVAALDAPARDLRRRAARVLMGLEPTLTRPALAALLAGAPPARASARAAAARLLAALAAGGEEAALAGALRDPSPTVRRAAAAPEAPVAALHAALADADAEVVVTGQMVCDRWDAPGPGGT